ncbi:MAG: protein-(glutamine-N5) methyltransferase, release factor-specific, partial [Sphingobacteriaceae bacterium]
DISSEALKIAQKNALLNLVEVAFFQQDILKFNPVKEALQYSIIVSNPPYITPSEQKMMMQNVLDFEPHEALFVPENDPLLFYRAIADFASIMLEKNGLLFFEINEKFGLEITKLLQKKGFTEIKLRKDFYGKDRMIKALKV